MNKQLSIVGLLALFVVSGTAYSQETKEKEIQLDEVVISATKFKLKKEKVGKVIHKITQQEIQNNAGKTVMELLNAIPGVEIKGANSVQGAIKGTYIRGGRNRQVLVLIDGVPVIDPTGISQEYDLRLLSLSQIESIEVMKGASSTIYGSGAASGVVNIILKKAPSNTISGAYEVSVGTYNSATIKSKKVQDINHNATVSGSLSKFNYLASLSLSDIDGISSAKSITNQKFSTDPFRSESGVFKLGYRASNDFNIVSFFNIDNLEYSFDAGRHIDSETNKATQKQVRIGVKPTYSYENGKVFAVASFNRVKREMFGNSYEGKSTNIEAVNKWDINSNTQLISGVNYQKHFNQTNSAWGNIENDVANFNTLDVFAAAIYTTDFNLTINVGGRLNKHSNYGSHLVYHINPSYNVINTDKASLKLLTSYSTAFIAPSLYQLFSVYGNQVLDPETNKTFEIGFEIGFEKWFDVNVVYFSRKESNAIIFNGLSVAPWGQYGNATSNIKANGVETTMTIRSSKNLEVTVGYAYTDKDEEADYIPQNKLTAQFNYKPFNNAFVSLVYKNVSERTGKYYDASVFSTVEEQLPSYQLMDVNANYKLLDDKITVFGSITNLFNEDYEETLGYTTRGRNFKLGVRFQF